MDRWLKNAGMHSQRQGNCAVHVCLDSAGAVVGFFALAIHEVYSFNLPQRARNTSQKTQGVLLAKLGLHASLRGRALGPQLVLEAIRSALASAAIVGGRVIIVDAQNAALVKFYTRLNFLPTSSATPLKLYMRMKTAHSLVEAADNLTT